MYKHHAETIERISQKLQAREEILALLIGGSIAHGFAAEESDVDIMIVVGEEEYARRAAAGELTYWEKESSTYEAGYIDGKYISPGFVREVARRGSEPARFAFQDAIVAFSRLPGLRALVADAARYPRAEKERKIESFYAQFEAWHWYCGEALKLKDPYLLPRAAANFALFAGRLVLAVNERLYPYHKWFLRVLAGVERKPEGFMDMLLAVLRQQEAGGIEALYRAMVEFGGWQDQAKNWPQRFLADTELAWMRDQAPVEDW